MFRLLWLTVIIFCIHQCYSSEGDTMLVPDDNGNPIEVLIQCPENYKVAIDLEKQVKFHLYRRFKNNTEEMVTMKVGGPIPNIFLPKVRTKILIAGFMNTLNSNMIQSIKKAYFSVGIVTSINVIAVDWSALAGSTFVRCYTRPKENSVAVGNYVGSFIDFMAEKGVVELDSVHLIGHSLGAHVAGIAGQNLSGTVDRITGLDPIGVDYCSNNDTFMLDKSDAKFVDVIHTDTQMLGIKDPCGHVDFYPWGGGHQNGCKIPTCSHSRAHAYFKESIETTTKYPAYACATLDHLRSTEMNLEWEKCETALTNFMGESTNYGKTGLFYTSLPNHSASSSIFQSFAMKLLLVAMVIIGQRHIIILC